MMQAAMAEGSVIRNPNAVVNPTYSRSRPQPRPARQLRADCAPTKSSGVKTATRSEKMAVSTWGFAVLASIVTKTKSSNTVIGTVVWAVNQNQFPAAFRPFSTLLVLATPSPTARTNRKKPPYRSRWPATLAMMAVHK